MANGSLGQLVIQIAMDPSAYQKAAGDLKSDTQSLGSSISGAGAAGAKGMDNLGASTMAARRELVVMLHELASGNIKNFVGSMTVMGEHMDSLQALLTPVNVGIGAVVAVIGGSVGIVAHAAESLAQYGKQIEGTAASTGISTDAIQQWNFAAKSVGVDGKDATKAIEALADAQNKAVGGNKDAAAAFAAVGISLADLKKSSPDQLLPKLADAFQNSADGAGKSAVANELFGSSAAELIPLLDKGSDGLAALGQQATATGAVIEDGLIEQMTGLEAHFEESAAKMDALNTSAKTELLPTIVALTDAFSDNASMGPLLHEFYADVGDVARGAAIGLAAVVTAAQQVGTAISTAATISNRVGLGDVQGVVDAARDGYKELKDEQTSYQAFVNKMTSVPQPVEGVDFGKGEDWGKTISYSAGNNGTKRADESGIDSQLTKQQQQQKLVEDDLKSHLSHLKSLRDQNLIDEEAYLQEEHDANQQALTKELAIAQQQLDIASGKKNKSAMERYGGEVKQLQQKLLANDQQFTDDTGKLSAKRHQAINAYADTLVDQLETAQSSADLQVASVGMGDQEAQHYSQLIQLQEDYNQRASQLNRQFNDGQIDHSQYSAELQYLSAWYGDRVAITQDGFTRMRAAQGNWENGATQAFQNYADSAQNVAAETSKAFTDLFSGMEDALVQFVTTGKLNFSQLAQSVIADIVRMQVRAAESSLFGSIGSMLGLNLGGSAVGANTFGFTMPTDISGSGALFGLGAGLHLATGGSVWGAGTGTSDSVNAHLSNGEFVVKESVASQPGMRSFLTAINGGATIAGGNRFANGGPVSMSGASAVQPNVNVTIQNAPAGTQVQRSTGPGGVPDIKVILPLIDQHIAGGIQSGKSSTAKVLQTQYGLNRAAGIG